MYIIASSVAMVLLIILGVLIVTSPKGSKQQRNLLVIFAFLLFLIPSVIAILFLSYALKSSVT